jgi:hypothetical protein
MCGFSCLSETHCSQNTLHLEGFDFVLPNRISERSAYFTIYVEISQADNLKERSLCVNVNLRMFNNLY